MWPIIGDHLRTLVTKPRDEVSCADIALMYGVPLIGGVFVAVFDWRLSASAPLISAVALFAALLFALLVRVLDDSAKLADRSVGEGVSKRILERAGILRSLGANVAYATLACIAAAAVLVVASQFANTDGALSSVWSGASTGVLLHVGLTFLMVLRRAYLWMRAQLVIAETGDDS